MTTWTENDVRFMRLALELARQGYGKTRPNPAVGAVIVDHDGGVLGQGFHRRAGLPHAEIEALNAAAETCLDVRGATMYVTLEPCDHHGRTGPCSEMVLEAGIARVVVAMRDPNVAARGGVERLREGGVSVDCGCLEEEALLLNPEFNTFHMLDRPLVTMKWAMTLDGCTSVTGGDSKWITGAEAREEVHRRRARHDAVLVGIGTALRDDARLTVRLRDDDLEPRFPYTRIVLDSSLRLPSGAAFLHREPEQPPPLIVCAEDADPTRERELKDEGAEVMRLSRGTVGVSVLPLLKFLHDRRIQSLYVEGGRTVAGSFLEEKAVDRIQACMAPILTGGAQEHLGPIRRAHPLTAMSEAIRLHHLSVSSFGDDVLVEGWLSNHLFKV